MHVTMHECGVFARNASASLTRYGLDRAEPQRFAPPSSGKKRTRDQASEKETARRRTPPPARSIGRGWRTKLKPCVVLWRRGGRFRQGLSQQPPYGGGCDDLHVFQAQIFLT
jgi:hypothetical protein